MFFWMPKVPGRAAAAEGAGTGLNVVTTSGLCSCGSLKMLCSFCSARVSTLSSLSWLVFSEDNCICLFFQFPLPCRSDAVLVSTSWLPALCRCCSGRQILVFTQTEFHWWMPHDVAQQPLKSFWVPWEHVAVPQHVVLAFSCSHPWHFSTRKFLLILYIPKVQEGKAFLCSLIRYLDLPYPHIPIYFKCIFALEMLNTIAFPGVMNSVAVDIPLLKKIIVLVMPWNHSVL